MPDDLDRLVDGLRALPLDLDAGDIADLLWLSATTRVGASRSPDAPDQPDVVGTNPLEPEEDPEDAANGAPEEPSPGSEPDGLYDGTSTDDMGRPARQVRIRRPRGLRVPLEMARSLRAFNRRWQAGRGRLLDLDASVAAYARTGRLTPVFRSAPERWFEATVLVDDSPSMDLWRGTVSDFTAMLRQLGAFRSVRSLTLDLEGDVPRVRNAAGRVTHPRQLRSSTGRRLVLVVSDCLADAWSGGAVWRMLWEWAGSTPTALVNPLPSSLWRRTGLDLPAVRVSSASVGGANTMLRYQLPWDLVDRTGERWLPVPTLAMTAHSRRRWAATLMRADPVGTDAVLVPSAGRVAAEAGDPVEASSVESFRHVASDEAFRLAVLSSPHDPVSLQMLELLRDQLVPAANAGDMAEIIASGVATAERAAGSTVLRVRPELRHEFQRLLSAPEAWRVHEVLTDYVATHAGTPGDLMLAVPDPTGSAVLPAELQPFADASRSTLRLLGIVPRAPAARVDELARLVSGAPMDDVLAAYRAVAPDAPDPGTNRTDIVRALDRLEGGGVGLPPRVEFAVYLAMRVDRPLARDLRYWADTQAQEFGIVDAFTWVRAAIDDRTRNAVADPSPTVSSAGGSLWPLVRALENVRALASQQDRDFVVRLLSDRLGPLLIERSPRTDAHLFNIVEVLDRRPDGLPALLDILRELDGGTHYLDEIASIIHQRDKGERRAALLRALRNAPAMRVQQDRDFVVRLLSDRLGPLLIERSPRTDAHLSNIVEALDRRPDGLAALLDVLTELDEGTVHMREVARIIAERDTHSLWPEEERERLFGLLSGMVFADLVRLYRQVAGANAPELPDETTYREVFDAVAASNTDADGLPRPIVFVEHLAEGRRPELATELRRWCDRQASRLGAITELQALRRSFRAPPPGPAPNEPAYLVLSIRRIGGDSEHYALRSWSQIDLSEGWRPVTGLEFTGRLDEVRREVAMAIEDVETRWARYQPDIHIEFLLPGELLNLDVDQWPWEVESVLPEVPIGCRYSCSVRSLERMQQARWHRPWQARWSVLTGQLQQNGTIESESVRWAEEGDTVRRVIVDLENQPSLVSLVLSGEPDNAVVAVGLRSGVPVMVWPRGDCDPGEFAAAVQWLLHDDSSTVLRRLRQLRTEAYQSGPGHVGHNIVLLWDDPQRLIDSAVQPWPESGPSRA